MPIVVLLRKIFAWRQFCVDKCFLGCANQCILVDLCGSWELLDLKFKPFFYYYFGHCLHQVSENQDEKKTLFTNNFHEMNVYHYVQLDLQMDNFMLKGFVLSTPKRFWIGIIKIGLALYFAWAVVYSLNAVNSSKL